MQITFAFCTFGQSTIRIQVFFEPSVRTSYRLKIASHKYGLIFPVKDSAIGATGGNPQASTFDIKSLMYGANCAFWAQKGGVSAIDPIEVNTNIADAANFDVQSKQAYLHLTEFGKGPGDLVAVIYSAGGRLIGSQKVTINGSPQVNLQTRDLSGGIYLVILIKDGAKQKLKLVVPGSY